MAAARGASTSTVETVREVDLDWRSSFWVMASFVGLLAVTALIRGAPRAIAVLAVGTLLALALDPVAGRVSRRIGGHRAVGVTAVMAALLLIVVAVGALLIPRAVTQGRDLSRAAVAGLAILAVGIVLRVPLTPLLVLWVALFDLVPQIGGSAGGVPFVLPGSAGAPRRG